MRRTTLALAIAGGLLASAAGQASAAGSWTDEPVPSGHQSGALNAVDAADGETWAFGSGTNGSTPVDEASATYRRDAEGWHEIPTPNIGMLTDGEVTGHDDAWAVGSSGKDDGGTLHWDGKQWTKAQLAAPPEGAPKPVSLKALAPDDVWVSGAAGQHGMVQHWDGKSWTALPVPQLPGVWSLDNIEGTSTNDLWAVGGFSSPDRNVALHWDGTTWTEMPVPDGSGQPDDNEQLDNVLPLAPDDVWVSGASGPRSTPKPFTAHWDGARWTNVDLGERTGDVTNLTQSRGEVLLFGANAGGDPYVLRHDGTQWTDAGPAPRGKIYASTPQDGGLLGVGTAGKGGPGVPYASTYQQ